MKAKMERQSRPDGVSFVVCCLLFVGVLEERGRGRGEAEHRGVRSTVAAAKAEEGGGWRMEGGVIPMERDSGGIENAGVPWSLRLLPHHSLERVRRTRKN